MNESKTHDETYNFAGIQTVTEATELPSSNQIVRHDSNHTNDKKMPRMSVIGKVGAVLANLYKKDNYHDVDINQRIFMQDAFRMQSGNLGKQLFGSKVATIHSLASKGISQEILSEISERIYHKIAGVASTWATYELARDVRFTQLGVLTNDEKHVFADEIVARSRVWAIAGSVSGVLGLKGVVLDTAWLLMLSLKSVFQLALIYDKPLTGEDGIRIAYGILAGANLEKLQEKQLIMTSLALGSIVLKNASIDENGLSTELKKASAKYQSGAYDMYAKQFDELGRHIDLEKLNPRWLQRILPVATTLVAVHYNSVLIDEVLGTAMATFRAADESKVPTNTLQQYEKNPFNP